MNTKILLQGLIMPPYFFGFLRVTLLSILLSIAFGATNTAGAQTISFRISERTLLLGDTVVIKWKVEGVRKRDSLHLTGYEGTPPVAGELKVSPEHDVTYTLTHIRRNKTTQRKIKVKVYHPEVLLFSGPETALYQVPVQLKWRTRHATRVSLTDVEGHLPLDGSRLVTPNGPMTYSLEVCNRNNRCVTAIHKINMQGDFLRGTSAIAKGGAGELQWRVLGATRVKLEGFDTLLPAEGRMTISPQQSREYTLTAVTPGQSGNDSTIRMSVKVLVVPQHYIQGVKPFTAIGKNQKLLFEIIHVDWKRYPDEMVFRVMITDTAGNYITGLAPPHLSEARSKEHFLAIIESLEGVDYPIQDFSVKEIRNMSSTPRDIALVLDYSGSMAGWFKELDEATLGFIRRKHGADRLAILRFDDKIGIEAPLTRDGQSVISKVKFNRGRAYGGSTALYAASGAGMELLTDTTRDRVLMVMTDGFENSSMYFWGKHFTKANEVLLHARREHITINTINFRGQANTPLLEALADMTGGRSYLLRNEKEIEKVFNELQHLYHNHYELRYRPAEVPGDRTISLLYQSDKDQKMITTAKAWISDSLDLDVIERTGLGLDSTLMQHGNQSVLLRQTVALFDFDKWELDSSSAQKLDRVIAYLEFFPNYNVVIQGHSDLVGNNSYCRYISRARAKAVYDYLLKGGIPAKRMKYEGKGKSEPVWQVEEAAWQARENRRVELLFIQ